MSFYIVFLRETYFCGKIFFLERDLRRLQTTTSISHSQQKCSKIFLSCKFKSALINATGRSVVVTCKMRSFCQHRSNRSTTFFRFYCWWHFCFLQWINSQCSKCLTSRRHNSHLVSFVVSNSDCFFVIFFAIPSS